MTRRMARWFQGSKGLSLVLGFAFQAHAQAPAPVAPAPAPAPAPVQPAPGPAQLAPAQPAPAPAQPWQSVPATAPAAPAAAPGAPGTPPPAAEPPPVAPAPNFGPPGAPPESLPPPQMDFGVPPPPPPPLPPVETSKPWYEGFSFGAFADAYVAYDFNAPKAPQQARTNPTRAYDTANGFSLSFIGLDVLKTAEPVGGAISLRFGPSATRLNGACVDSDNCDASSSLGLEYVKQAFVSFRPGQGMVTLDLGKFDTPYGAEVAEAQYNINYTRGALYWLGQPAYHTGLRVGIDPDRHVNLKLLAVNGWNRTIDNNAGKTFGLQGTFRAPKLPGSEEDLATVALGYMIGPEHTDSVIKQCGTGEIFDPEQFPETGCGPGMDGETSGVVDRGSANTKGLRHFLDLTAVLTPNEALKVLINGSLGIDNHRTGPDDANFVAATWWGVMAGARFAVDEQLGLGGRVEYFADVDGYALGEGLTLGNDVRMVTGTLSADYSPAKPLKFMLDGRLDWSNYQIFPSGERETKGSAFSLTLGAIVSTN